MTLWQLIIGWFYYGIYFMGLSVVATIMLNKVARRYSTAPLMINAVSIGLLLVLLATKQLTNEQLWFNLFFRYMPVVAASAVFNSVYYIINKGKPLHDAPIIEDEIIEESNKEEFTHE